MQSTQWVLVTGSSGRLGQAAVGGLVARGHRVRGFDLNPSPGVTEMAIGTIADPEAVRAALQDVGTLIHLAATPDDADFEAELVPNNVVGLYRVMEAARYAGVTRMILASSGQLNDTQQQAGPWPCRPEDPPTPRYWYAATKMLLESAGYSFAIRHNITVLAVRLGWCPRTVEQVREIESAARFQDVYLSPGDAARFFVRTVEADWKERFAIVYATSRPLEKERLALEPARRLLNFEPAESWPQGIEIVSG